MPDNEGLTPGEAVHANRARTNRQQACDAHLDDLTRVYELPLGSVPTDDGFVRLRIPFNPAGSLTGSPGLMCDEKVL